MNPFDSNLTSPFISNGILNIYMINSDTITVNGNISLDDTINISNKLIVDARHSQTQIFLVKYAIYSLNHESLLHEGYLNDVGYDSDSIAGDGIYSSTISFQIPRVISGLFLVKIQAIDLNDSYSNELILSFNIIRSVSYPTISNLIATDTVRLPVSGEIPIPLHISVSDSDGLADIKEVFFRNLDFSDPTLKVFLFDNGNILDNGDSIAGDGIFSRIIKLKYDNTPKPNRLEFQAKDFSGMLSNKIIHTLYVVAH